MTDDSKTIEIIKKALTMAFPDCSIEYMDVCSRYDDKTFMPVRTLMVRINDDIFMSSWSPELLMDLGLMLRGDISKDDFDAFFAKKVVEGLEKVNKANDID
jgi:hypothetical protein